MQTTLRIDTEVYRAAKAQAASQGETITRFIELARTFHRASRSMISGLFLDTNILIYAIESGGPEPAKTAAAQALVRRRDVC